MKINIERDTIQEILTFASRFISTRLTSSTALQGVLLKGEKDKIHIYSTNLTTYFHTSFKADLKEKLEIVVEPRKILEFLNYLASGMVEIEVQEKQISITQEKTKGNFPLMISQDFPLPPSISEKDQKMATQFFQKSLPLVLFPASADDTRPVLTGVNIVRSDNELLMVSTDGFRLSVIKQKSTEDIPSMIIPADFLEEILRTIKDEKEVLFSFSQSEKIVRFTINQYELYSRLIEGEFPPFDKVIPAETKSKAIVDKAELIRNVKLISVFARDFSNVVICEFTKKGLTLRPKKEANQENSAFQEIEYEGEDQKVAFNFKFLLDLLNHIDTKEVVVEMLRSDAPVVFKIPKDESFLHIIMPVRLQE